MTREDLLGTNAGIVRSVVAQAVEHSPDAVLVIFANPMDAMCHVALETSGLPAARVIGQGGMLDSTRYRTFIAMELGVSVRDVSAWVLGGHTEATMVPIVSTATVGGVPLTALMAQDRIDAVVDRTMKGGAEIVGLLKTGSAFTAPAAATIEMGRRHPPRRAPHPPLLHLAGRPVGHRERLRRRPGPARRRRHPRGLRAPAERV